MILLNSCNFDNSQDDVTSKDYYFDSLRVINLKNDIHMILIQDSLNFIRMLAPENRHDEVEPEFISDTVILTNKKGLEIFNRYNHKIEAEIHFSTLNYIFHQGGGEIRSEDTIRLHNFSIATNGASGNIMITVDTDYLGIGLSTGTLQLNVKGKTDILSIWSTSYALPDFYSLKASKVVARNNSSVDFYMNVTDNLKAETQYLGNIYYKGNPTVTEIKESGSGKIIQVD